MITAIEKIQAIEDNLMQTLGQVFLQSDLRRNKIIKGFFIIFTRIGDGLIYPVFIVLSFSFSNLTLNYVLSFLLAFTVERILYFTIKNTMKRIRPFERLKINEIPVLPPDRYSFPSGHTSAAFLFAALVSFYFPSITFIVFIYAILVGLSRIILNLHYPTDVLIGSQLGISIAIISVEIIDIIL